MDVASSGVLGSEGLVEVGKLLVGEPLGGVALGILEVKIVLYFYKTSDFQIVGDDLTVTNPLRIKKAIELKSCNAPTAMSAMVTSSVSPERWETMTPQPSA
jgi:hypothetical protein